MEEIRKIAARNRERALEVIRQTNIPGLWAAAGVEVRMVGSLRMGLLVKHRDIDFHVYSSPLSIADDFAVMSQLALNPRIHKIEYTNLIDTPEQCIEWHAWYRDAEDELWQIDMIHILSESYYDGYFERVADRIVELLTPETKDVIMRLKYETPETEKIMGIEYYRAVIGEGIRNYADFARWRQEHPVTGVLEWIP